MERNDYKKYITEQFQQEFECEFLGSVNTTYITCENKNTLLDVFRSQGSVDQYENLKVIHMCTVDVARGVDKDYSAFVVFDVTNAFKVVAIYKNNEVKLLYF
ncbi:MAG: hypothetical protein CM15mV8_0910 [Caudoviricetes sp.]|nr:MAG: hypothetical protein CM15mV8_0910 [Caudoviricetes sp.]